jgi:hypothetical protein
MVSPMASWNVHRARATRVLANLFVIAGFVAVVPLVLAVFLPGPAAMPLLAFIPDLPAGLADQVRRLPWIPAGLVVPILIALAGLAVMIVGRGVASRQVYVLEGYRLWREDAKRRIDHYRSDARIEPTLRPE